MKKRIKTGWEMSLYFTFFDFFLSFCFKAVSRHVQLIVSKENCKATASKKLNVRMLRQSMNVGLDYVKCVSDDI